MVPTDLPSKSLLEDGYVQMSKRIGRILELPVVHKPVYTYSERVELRKTIGGEHYHWGKDAQWAWCLWAGRWECEMVVEDRMHFEEIKKLLREWTTTYESLARSQDMFKHANAIKAQFESLRAAYRERAAHYDALGEDVSAEFLRTTELYRMLIAEHVKTADDKGGVSGYIETVESVCFAMANDDYGLTFAQFAALRRHTSENKREWLEENGRMADHFRDAVGVWRARVPKTIDENVRRQLA